MISTFSSLITFNQKSTKKQKKTLLNILRVVSEASILPCFRENTKRLVEKMFKQLKFLILSFPAMPLLHRFQGLSLQPSLIYPHFLKNRREEKKYLNPVPPF